MAKDLIYIFDKETKVGTPFGEIQSDFNMDFTIDGTKDSCQIIVWSWQSEEIEANTLVYHPKTTTWWIVARDKAERYQNENGFLYIHSLQLEGAIELLNARDLTDCGFNQKTYTISTFITRLFELSNFEYTLEFDSNIDLDLTKRVDIVKTFENYTLLSALREFLDGYNSCPELYFNAIYRSSSDTYLIVSALLYIIPKTGDPIYGIYDIDTFDDVRETKILDKNSFGSIVVSNTENVMSSIDKTFPELGAIRPSSASYEILAQNGFIRLPSSVFKANWLKLVFNIAEIRIDIKIGDYTGTITPSVVNGFPNPINMSAIDNYIQKATYIVQTETTEQGLINFYNTYIDFVRNNKKDIYNYFLDMSSITLYNGNYLNPVTGAIIKGDNVPYIPTVVYEGHLDNSVPPQPYNLPLIFCDKDMRDTLPKTWQGISWKRGDDRIFDFNSFEAESGQNTRGAISISKAEIERCVQAENKSITLTIASDNSGNYVRLSLNDGYGVHFRDTHWIVNYIPMGDFKIKLNNDRGNKDIHLYNQNGKLNDGVALSKLMNSYAKEISSDNITRYMQYYDFENVPKVGAIVKKDNDLYTINNVSLDISQNESEVGFGYFINAEFSLSKNVAVKSSLVNPDTNIRDYGIPQNYNVKRKQLYRDIVELSYEFVDYDCYAYSTVLNMVGLSHFPIVPKTTSVMRIEYDQQVENSLYWYYQLDNVNYPLAKSFYIICDFKDNNIIGYSSQNVFSGFDITRIFAGLTDTQNTPISYTDESGKLKGINLLFMENDALTSVYNTYEYNHKNDVSQQVYENWLQSGGSLYNYSPFIPQDIYTDSKPLAIIDIEENTYKKDALEVPVFEYALQVVDNANFIFGDNIFVQEPNCIYFYSYATGQNLSQNNATTNAHVSQTSQYVFSVNNGAEITAYPFGLDQNIPNEHLEIKLYTIQAYSKTTKSFTNTIAKSIPTNTDIAIFRHTYNLEYNREESVDLVLILKDIKQENLVNSTTICPFINARKEK